MTITITKVTMINNNILLAAIIILSLCVYVRVYYIPYSYMPCTYVRMYYILITMTMTTAYNHGLLILMALIILSSTSH